MTLDEFWNLIEEAKRSTEKVSEIPNWLVNHLSQLPESEIVSFRSHFQDCRYRANDARLWLAAAVIRGGCSDDCFDYFRGWLIAQGRAVFEAALVEPDSMVELESFDGSGEYPRLEKMLSVDADAFLKRSGRGVHDFEALERYEALCPKLSPQVLRNEELMDLSEEGEKALFPKLAARFPRGIVGEQLKKYQQGC